MPEATKLTYTNNGDGTGHTVWREAHRKIGRVMEQGPRWLAITPEHRVICSVTSMSVAARRLNEHWERKYGKFETTKGENDV